MLVGGNHTGKSTVIRHLFYVFGCETRSMGKSWDYGVHAALDFELGHSSYRILRTGDLFSLWSDNQIIWATRSKGLLRDKLSELFDFILPLTARSTGVQLARPSLYFLPFYIDQDGSWEAGWNTFLSLNEFQQWQKPAIELALDIRSSEYWKTHSELLEQRRSGELLAQEHSILKRAKDNLTSMFPRQPWFVDGIAFRRELRDLEGSATELAKQQDHLRIELTEVTTSIDVLKTQLKMLDDALQDHEQDMVFLDEQRASDELICPTCGTHHATSFHQRLLLDAEADELRQMKAKMKTSLLSEEKRFHEAKNSLKKVDVKIAELDALLTIKKNGLTLRDIVDRAGNERAHFAFDTQEAHLNQSIGANFSLQRGLEEKLKSLNNPSRGKEIRATFNSFYAQFAKELEVPPTLETRTGEVQLRPKEGGSGGPRAILAYYFALSHTAIRFSDGFIPPLVIDSPHPKAQDEVNRPLVTEFIVNNAVEGQQVIVGLEEAPPDSVSLSSSHDLQVDLTEKFRLLRKDEYGYVGNVLYRQILEAQQTKRLETP